MRGISPAGLAETAQVTLAPLHAPLARDGLLWYAQHALRSLPRRIELLRVDGPPAFEPETALSRYPALPALTERLTRRAIVVLDDIDRAGELQVLGAWERECSLRFEIQRAKRIASGAEPDERDALQSQRASAQLTSWRDPAVGAH
jgi:hypothetical protein